MDTSERLTGAAAVACVACRKLKMRCIGATNPPCARCVKSRRECVVRFPNRHQHRNQPHLSPRPGSRSPADRPRRHSQNPLVSGPSPTANHSATSAVALDISDSAGEISHNPESDLQSRSLDQTTLPSIFSTSPITIATTTATESSDYPSGGDSGSCDAFAFNQIPDSIIFDLVEFFCQRLLCYVPALTLEALDDIASLITNRRPLAYAMAFVASTFSLGCRSIHLALAPHMSQLLVQGNHVAKSSPEENWTLLQALGVLYCYPMVTVSMQSAERTLSPWAVKSAVESCGMQMSLHQSITDLQALLKKGSTNISSSIAYRRCFYWLWLFVKSRHHSILTRTPPTVRNDSTIKSTLELLLRLEPQPPVWRVLAETALHRLWDEAARSDTCLAEWWCAPPTTMDVAAVLTLLQNIEDMLEEWNSVWLPPTDMGAPDFPGSNPFSPSMFANSITSFMGVLTRFSMVSFAAPILSHQLVLKTGLATFSPLPTNLPEASAFLACVLRSADAASKCCDIILHIKPTHRDFLRYTPDYGFTMITLCCLHMMYAHRMCPENPTLKANLHKAAQVAHLMTELPVGSNICPKVYGEYILFQLRNETPRRAGPPDNRNAAQSIADPQQHADFHFWSQLPLPVGATQPPLENDNWTPHDGYSGGLWPLDSNLLDMFNICHDTLQEYNADSL